MAIIICIALCSCKESKQDYTNIKTSTINYVNCNIKPLDEIPLELLGEKEYFNSFIIFHVSSLQVILFFRVYNSKDTPYHISYVLYESSPLKSMKHRLVD